MPGNNCSLKYDNRFAALKSDNATATINCGFETSANVNSNGMNRRAQKAPNFARLMQMAASMQQQCHSDTTVDR